MFFKILQLVQFILSLILEAEGQFPLGAGVDKKQSVLNALGDEMSRQGLIRRSDEETLAALERESSGLIDNLVGMLNSTGAFGVRAEHFVEPEAPEPPKLPPSP